MVNRFPGWAAAICALITFATQWIYAQRGARLTSLAAVHRVTHQEATLSIPVRFESTVVYYRRGALFVQDDNIAIFVNAPTDLQLVLGDRVQVEGVTRDSFRPEILSHNVTLLHHGLPPRAVEADFGSLMRVELDCRRATVRGVVRAANLLKTEWGNVALIDLSMAGGPIQVQIDNVPSTFDLKGLLDNNIEITGAVAGRFDNKDQMTGIILTVPSLKELRILKPAPFSLSSIPTMPFDQVVQNLRVDDRTERVRVEGILTYYQAGAAVLQDGKNAIWVDTLSQESHKIGDFARISGFPAVRDGSVVLTLGELQSSPSVFSVYPEKVSTTELSSGMHAFELVSAEGELIMRVKENVQDQYVIASEGKVFSAFYRHPELGSPFPLYVMRDVPVGSRVRVTGICVLDRGDQFFGPPAFHLLLRSTDDVVVRSGPSPISVRNLLISLGILSITLFVIVGRSLLIERRLRRKDLADAVTVDRWRTRVVDGINHAVPLRQTLLQITELLSFKFQSEYCWAETDIEGLFGNCPEPQDKIGLEVVEFPILSRSNAELGKIWVGSHSSQVKYHAGSEWLKNAIRLAALAIETRATYSDLLRRSERDPLTNAKNRAAFDHAIDMEIERQQHLSGLFGIIYIDVDDFKPVNDQFGHRVGDSYLQGIAARLADQLRSDDTLARVGGDEFAILISGLNNREELSEIEQRIGKSFERPIAFEQITIPVSISVGCSAYPHDGYSRTALLEAADARMYVRKRVRKQNRLLERAGAKCERAAAGPSAS